MSDYEATAYLSLEKLKVSIQNRFKLAANSNFTSIGETYARVPAILRQNQTRTAREDEILEGSARAERQGSQAGANETL